jgi:uncharacterized protein (DUF1015 family)
MADVRPLRGFRYNAGIAAEDTGASGSAPALPASGLAAVVTPPYDVISPDAQARYYDRHQYNIIRLELGLEQPDDDALNNRYTRAAEIFARWRLEGVLQQDAAPGMYVYQQRFGAAGKEYTRTSLLARVRLEPWDAGVVLRHEHTLAKPRNDRLRLLRACAANLSPIMSLYDDPEHVIVDLVQQATQAAPLAEFADEAGETHRLWHLADETVVAQLHDTFAAKQLFIADGHHRYETALAYRDEVRELHRGLTPDEAANFVLMALVALDDPGLVVLPTHRLVRGLDAKRVSGIPTALKRYWELTQLDNADDAEALVAGLAEAGNDGAVAAVVATNKHRWLARLNDEGRTRMRQIGEPAAWQQLDVAVAHELIVDAALGIPRDAIATGDQITYTHAAADALSAVQSGAAQVTILLNPTRPEQVRDVAQTGAVMPQKSTYFYPKLITGVVINPVW